MKRGLILFLAAALAFVGCKKEVATGVQGGDQTVTFSVVAADATKAEATTIPETINKCVAVVRMYGANDQLLDDIYAQPACTKDGESYKFSVDLMGGQKYKVTVLLYTDGVYTVDSKLEAIERVDKTARNAANLDMFSASINYSAGETTPLIIARRPFAQLNLITTDLVEHFEPSVVLKYTAPKTFNAVIGVVSGTQEYVTAGDLVEMKYGQNSILTTDYIFASVEKSLISVEMTATKTNAFVRTFDNLPLQRNYKTNVIGKLLTVDAPFTVQVNADWYTPANDIQWQNAENIAAANAILAEASTGEDLNIKVNVPDDAATVPVQFTPANSGSDIALTFGNHSAGTPLTITFTNEVTTVNPASVTVEAPAGTTLVFETETHVVINGTNYGVISGTFSANTLVINKGVSVEKVIMTAGGLEVHGTLGAFEAAEGHGAIIVRDCEGLSESVYNALKEFIDPHYYVIENETTPKTYDIALNAVAEINGVVYATLAEAINAGKEGETIKLLKDIEMTSNWTPLTLYADFDGQNHTISNLKVQDWTGSYIGLFDVSYSNIKNLKIRNAQMINAESSQGNARGAVLVGDFRRGNIENCHIENATVKAYQKVGGLVGFLSQNADDGKDMSIVGCSVKNVTMEPNFTDPDDGLVIYQAAGITGYLSQGNRNITIKDNVVEGITIKNAYTEYYKRYMCHAFIGNVLNDATVEGKTVNFINNTVEQVAGLVTGAYTTDYWCWAGNKDEFPGYKGQIIVDGTPWPSPVAKIGETNYMELAEAFAAVKAGETIEILKAGEYKVPGIPQNITIKGDVDGVVFNCVGSGSIASIPNGCTFENVSFKMGQSGYHGFQHAGTINMNGCTFEGLFFSYGDMNFTECTFNQTASEYCMWDYGQDLTYTNCVFNCNGKFINVYNEGNGNWKLKVEGCTFNSTKKNKAALNIKASCGAKNLGWDVTINNCTVNDAAMFPEASGDATSTLYVGSPVWQVDDRTASSLEANIVKVTVDGAVVYGGNE